MRNNSLPTRITCSLSGPVPLEDKEHHLINNFASIKQIKDKPLHLNVLFEIHYRIGLS